MTEANTAETIADLARKGVPAHIVKSDDGREFLIVPPGMIKHDVPDEHGLKRTLPSYLKQDVTLQAVDSLVVYVNRFKTTDTILFADIDANTIRAGMDFHTPGTAGAEPTVKRAVHRASLALPFSEEWKDWNRINNKLMGQLEFARFIEKNAADVTAPLAGELLDAVRDLQAHRKVNFTKAVRTASNNENFEFTSETEARTKGGIELPHEFVLGIPVYFGESDVELHAFLRWELSEEGGLALGIEMHRAEHVRQAVFKQIVLAAGDQTGCPVVYGKPS
jgi:uncharacterized protein YfdQ (DUF2303 family)